MDKYAIFETGSKQYRVKEGDEIDVELLDGVEEGLVEFKDVLFVRDGADVKVGAPRVEGAVVRADVVSPVRGPKVIAYKYKKRKSYHRKVGHRQDYIRVKIKEVAHGA